MSTNTFKTMVFGLAALGAVTISASAAAATTVLSYVGNAYASQVGPRVFGPLTATIELAGPLGANFSGEVAWLSLAMSDGVETLSPGISAQAYFATDGAGEIVNWRVVAAGIGAGGELQFHTYNNQQGQFGIPRSVIDSASLVPFDRTRPTSLAFVRETPGAWTVTTRAEPGGVPEPATWALMIVGFGATGSALRRRRILRA